MLLLMVGEGVPGPGQIPYESGEIKISLVKRWVGRNAFCLLKFAPIR